MNTVEVQGIPIAYQEVGEGRPLLVIHGWQGDHRYMMADLEEVFDDSPGWRRVYIDLPGHGTTPAPDWLRNPNQMVDILIELVIALFGEEPFAVAGNSWGGMFSLALVRLLPEQVLGAGFLVPYLLDAAGNVDTPTHVTIITAPEAFDDLEPDEEWIPERLVEQSRRAVELIRRDDMPSIRDADQAFLHRYESERQRPAILDSTGIPFLRPSLILTGRQDATVGFAAAYNLLEEFPRATFATLDLAGHWLGRVERPDPFRALVRDWLGRMQVDQ